MPKKENMLFKVLKICKNFFQMIIFMMLEVKDVLKFYYQLRLCSHGENAKATSLQIGKTICFGTKSFSLYLKL